MKPRKKAYRLYSPRGDRNILQSGVEIIAYDRAEAQQIVAGAFAADLRTAWVRNVYSETESGIRRVGP